MERRSAVLIVMSIELMLNAVNINLIAAASHLGYRSVGEAFTNFDGQIIAIFVITVAAAELGLDRKSTRLNSSHVVISYAVFCLKKKNV